MKINWSCLFGHDWEEINDSYVRVCLCCGKVQYETAGGGWRNPDSLRESARRKAEREKRAQALYKLWKFQ